VIEPLILTESASPSADELVIALPSTFSVPVVIDQSSSNAQYAWIIDGDNMVAPTTINGFGTVVVSLPSSALSPVSCHTIKLLLAHRFLTSSAHPLVPDSEGAVSLTWFYLPDGIPAGCPTFDGGTDADIGPIVDAQAP
jgi:hypothetical protein